MKKRITTVILSMVLVAAIILESTPVAYAASGEYLDPTEPETEEYEVPTYVTVTLNVPLEVQANDYYCGPACVKAVVQCLTNTSSGQSVYAGLLGTSINGTYIGNIPAVINNAIGSNHYAYCDISSASYSTWIGYIKSSIDSGYPVIMLIWPNSANTGGFSYTVKSGHFIVISGYEYYTPTGTVSGLRIMDPHPVHNGVFWKYDLMALRSVNLQQTYHGIVK